MPQKPSVGDVDFELAVDVAVKLIEASKRAEIFSIGGRRSWCTASTARARSGCRGEPGGSADAHTP